MNRIGTTLLTAIACVAMAAAQTTERRRPPRREAFTTDTPFVHDPVMAFEDGIFYAYSTGMGVQLMTSADRRTWTVQPQPALGRMPEWTRDSVPGFRGHTWAPDILRYRDRWWMFYSCSTFGRNTSAIGLASSPALNPADTLRHRWTDHGCVVASREHRDSWNAIDPAAILDEQGNPWLAWGSFWDGIQLAPLDTTLHLRPDSPPRTIARRAAPADTSRAEPNPTSQHAGRNAVEAPFLFRHGPWFYLFVSHDYCCRGMKSNYKVVVGRSAHVQGPYLDREGRDMNLGGGTLVVQGDKQRYEAAGHCAVYDLPGDGGEPQTLFICHAYSIAHGGQSILMQRPVRWTADGWPELEEEDVSEF